jgi:hypothetical protein
MYPECRHVRPSGEGCSAAALSGSHWCYFHARMHSRQAQRQAEREALFASRRDTARRQQRGTNGRFAPPPLPTPPISHLGPSASQRTHPETSLAGYSSRQPGEAVDRNMQTGAGEERDTGTSGRLPEPSEGCDLFHFTPENTSFDLPAIEDHESIQLALIEVAQALAANQIDTKRAGLLLYALQVASANAKHVLLSGSGVRSVTYTENGTALGPQEYGWDVEDVEAEIEREANGYYDDGNEEEDEG